MGAMSYLSIDLRVPLDSVDATGEALEPTLTPVEDEDEAVDMIHILYLDHFGYM